MTNTLKPETHTDIKQIVWIERFVPEKYRAYATLARLDRPIGIWLLLLPGWWAIVLSAGGIFGMGLWDWYAFILFGVGAIVMRAAGCVINDLWDRDLDAKVERTQQRPVASGEIGIPQGLLFLATLLLIGFFILIQFNLMTVMLGLTSLPLIIAYPLMKRITWWPQAFLGVTFNFGALMGWSAVTGEIGSPALFLYLSGIFWTLGYDTIYAHQDKEDDALAGIKSTALKFGDKSKLWVGGFYACSFVFSLIAILSREYGNILPVFLILLPGGHMLWQLRMWNMADSASSLKIFKSNRDFGLLILSAFSFQI